MKKIAVLLVDSKKSAEGLRMAAGLSLLEDKVDVCLIDSDFPGPELPVINSHLEMLRVTSIGLYSNFIKEGFDFIATADLGKKLPEYDFVFPY